MSTKSTLKEDHKSEIEERSEEELLEEEIRNQVMNLNRSPFSILNKEKREIDYVKGVYKRKIQAEIESYKDPEDEEKRDTIQAQDILMLDRISI